MLRLSRDCVSRGSEVARLARSHLLMRRWLSVGIFKRKYDNDHEYFAHAWLLRLRFRGEKCRVAGPWKPRFIKRLQRRGITELYLNDMLGFAEENLDFLKDVPFITGVDVVGCIEDTGVLGLPTLRKISLQTDCKARIDFTKFPHLEELAVSKRSGVETAFKSKTITRLSVSSAPIRRTSELSEMTSLKKLILEPCRRLEEVDWLPDGIEELSIYSARKLNFNRLPEAAKSLRKLDIESCKNIRDLSFLSQLPELEYLGIAEGGEYESLALLATCKKLKVLMAYGNTRILDNDMSVFNELPELASGDVRLVERRSYFGYQFAED